MTTTMEPLRATAAPPAIRRLLRRLALDSAYLLTGFPLALIAFVVLVVGFCLGIGTFVTLAGIPILAATLLTARGFAELERWRISRVLDTPHAHGVYRPPAPDTGRWRRLFRPITDGQAWLDLLHGVIVFPVAVTTWSIMVTWWAGAVGGTLTVMYDWVLPHPPGNTDLSELLGMDDSAFARVTLYTAIGRWGTCSRTGWRRSASSSTRWSGSPGARPCSTPRSSPSYSYAGAATTRCGRSPHGSGRCWR